MTSGNSDLFYSMQGFVKIARTDELLSSRGLSIRVDGEEIAVFKVGSDLFAVRNDCPHQHFSLLHQGEIRGFALTCPMHGWTFDLRTGKPIIGGGNLKQYAVKVVGNDVWLERPTS
jgi:3-phenylpropionate/trans-cinnamate dioxygenase ferredoxin subunit